VVHAPGRPPLPQVLLADVVAERDLTEVEARALIDGMRADVADLGDRIEIAYIGRAWAALGYPSWDLLCEREFPSLRLRIPREQRAEQVQSLRSAGLSTRAIGSALGVGKSTVDRDLAGVPDGPPDAAPVTGQDGKTYQPLTHTPSPPAPAPAESTSNSQPTSGGDGTASPPPLSGAAHAAASGGGEPVPFDASAVADHLRERDAAYAGQAKHSHEPEPHPSKQRRKPLPDQARDAGWDIRKCAERIERIAADDRFHAHHDSERGVTFFREHVAASFEHVEVYATESNTAGAVTLASPLAWIITDDRPHKDHDAGQLRQLAAEALNAADVLDGLTG